MAKSQLLVGVSVGVNRLHTIIVREEANGYLRLMGEHRDRDKIHQGDQASLVDTILESILEASRDAQVSQDSFLSIGIALPGQIDATNETLLFAPNLRIRDAALVAALEKSYHCPISLINDVAAQGIGEQKIGAGKRLKHIVYLYVSYGIGSSIVIDGKLYIGADNLAGEFGHTAVCFDGPECSCGKTGCLEAFSSRRAMAKALRTACEQKRETIINIHDFSEEPLDLGNARIVQAIEQEDALTIQVVEDAGTIFGIGIATAINFLNPNVVVLGGDVVDEIDLFFERAVASARARSLSDNLKNVAIVRSALGTTAIAYGAAVFSNQNLE